MKIKILFETYEQLVTNKANSEKIFTNSGMLNDYEKLDFGFFPLGSGILTDRSKIDDATITDGGTMVLGNDFGTISYVEKCMKSKREDNSKTITNLQNIGLNLTTTFFTNLYLGIRNDKLYTGTSMTRRVKPLEQEYKDLCYNFFLAQLELINPKTVVCLGSEVGQTLSEFSNVFSGFSTKKNKISSLFADESKQDYIINTNDAIFEQRKFILIPHPSYAHINWNKHDIKNKIEKAIKVIPMVSILED